MSKSGFRAWQGCAVFICLVGFGFTLLAWKVWPYVSTALRGEGLLDLSYATEPEDGGPKFRMKQIVNLNGEELQLELARTPAEIQQGLSDRKSMGADQGMLFVFDEPARYAFWMNHMNFSLDMIWIRDGRVVEIAANLPPPSDTLGIPKTYEPVQVADMVLELTAGGAERYALTIGSDVSAIAAAVNSTD